MWKPLFWGTWIQAAASCLTSLTSESEHVQQCRYCSHLLKTHVWSCIQLFHLILNLAQKGAGPVIPLLMIHYKTQYFCIYSGHALYGLAHIKHQSTEEINIGQLQFCQVLQIWASFILLPQVVLVFFLVRFWSDFDSQFPPERDWGSFVIQTWQPWPVGAATWSTV